jgi:hypothetical protein
VSSRRQLRRNVHRFARYRARYVRLVTPSRRLAVTVRAAGEAHARAVERLSRNADEAYAQWRKTDEGSHECRPFYVSLGCSSCGLPDPYCGAGDGIGSCECSRCDCCGAPPDGCECGRDWEDYGDGDEDQAAGDYLCNDPSCDHLRARVEARKAVTTNG